MKRNTIRLIAAGLVATAALLAHGVAAGGLLGFRLLKIDGTMVRWGSAAEPTVTVTYMIVRDRMEFPRARNCRGLEPPSALLAASGIAREDFASEVRAAFEMWEQVTDIDFVEVDDPAKAGILIGAQSDPEGHAYANVDYRAGDGDIREIEQSLICLNPMKRWKIGFGGSLAVYDLRYTIAHEIGHAIGLDHPDSGNQLMSFSYSEQFRSLQAGDVEGIVRIYGLRPPTRSMMTRTANPGRRSS